jgi:hypothetical protein
MPDIHGVNPGRARSQQAIGKSAGGSAEVNGSQPGDIELKMLKGVLELVPAATDEFLRSGEGEFIGSVDTIAGFAGGLAVDEDLPGHDGALAFLATVAKPAFHQSLVHTNHGRRIVGPMESLRNFQPAWKVPQT